MSECHFSNALNYTHIQLSQMHNASFQVCWLHESSAEKREGLISSVTSYFDASQASKARVMKKFSLRSVRRSYKESQMLLACCIHLRKTVKRH